MENGGGNMGGQAIDWLLQTQDAAAAWPEAKKAIQSYTRARGSCINIQRQLKTLNLQGGSTARQPV